MTIYQFLSNQIQGGFGIREIARLAGVSPSTISRIYNGLVVPDIDTVRKILEPFGYEMVVVKRGVRNE